MSRLQFAAVIVVGLAFAGVSAAQTGASPGTGPSAPAGAPVAPAPAAPGPDLDAALAAARVALKTCQGLEQKVSVTVVDSAGIAKVLLASDGASARGVQSSTNKALTSLAFKAATSELDTRRKSDPALEGQLSANPAYNTHAGGLLILQGGSVIGAIGVGGAKGSEKDEACAKAALTELAAGLGHR